MNSVPFRPRLKKDLWSKFRRLGPKIRTKDTIRNPCQKLQLIHDPLCFQNPPIRSIYRKNPQSVRFLRPNPSIRKPINPLRKVVLQTGKSLRDNEKLLWVIVILRLLDWTSKCLSVVEGNSTNTCIPSSLLINHLKLQSSKAKLLLPVMPIAIVAYAFTL